MELDRKTGDFSLEEIMKEFGDEPEGTTPEEDVRVWDGVLPEEAYEPPVDLSDTVRLDDMARVLQEMEQEQPEEDLEATVRFQLDDTVQFSLPEEDGEVFEEYMPEPPEESVEPFSQGWEPEYDQPINDYVPPEPIPFRPRSRLHELKKKLVEGPERRYYQLTEIGLGKLQIAIFLSLIVSLLAACSTAMYAMGMVPGNRLRFLVFFQFFALLLSALLGSYQLMAGFTGLLRRRFSLDTLLLFSFVACLADGILCLKDVHVPCCAAFSLHVTMSLWSAYQKRNTEISQMDTMRKATRLNSLVAVPDGFEGRQVFMTGEGQVEDFMDTYNAPSGEEKTLSLYGIVALFVSLGSGILAGALHGISMGVQVFCASLLVAVPATSFITLSRPKAILQRRLHKHGTVICGWQGVKQLSRDGIYPLKDTDVFPIGSAKLNGVKFYGDRDPDEVVSYAVALIAAGGGGWRPTAANGGGWRP